MSSPIAILNRLERIFNVVEITEGTFLEGTRGEIIEVRAICANDYYVHPDDYPGYNLETVVYVWCHHDPDWISGWSDWTPADYLRDMLTEGSLRVMNIAIFESFE